MKPKLIIFTLALSLFYIFILNYLLDKPQPKLTSVKENNNSILKSDIFKFKVTIPPGLVNTGDELTLELTKDNEKIIISRTGSYYTNVMDDLEHRKKQNKLTVVDVKDLKETEYDDIRVQIQRPDNTIKTVYFLFVGGFVYNFNATSPELYDELEQVVQSFEYTGGQ